MFADVDETCSRQVELFRSSPLIPPHVVIHGYVWEVETMKLRRPFRRLSEKVNTAVQMGARGSLREKERVEAEELVGAGWTSI